MIDLFSKLPQIWQRLDLSVTDIIDGKGFLQRYLMAPDAKFRAFEDLIKEYLRSQNVEQLRDSFIPLLNDITGHRWKDSRSRIWNRNRIQIAISRASYKGTEQAIRDLARECGSTYCKILDMASFVGVFDRQASMPQLSHYFDSDYFHPGVFQLWLSDSVDIDAFMEDFEYLQPAGTKWIIRLCIAECHTYIELLDYGFLITTYGATYDYTYKIFNQEFGFYDHIPQVAWAPTIYSTYWSYLHDPYPRVYGQSLYNYHPQYPVDVVSWPVVWVPISTGEYSIYGQSQYDFLTQLPVVPILTYITDYTAVANARLDMGSLTFNWGEEELNFEDDFVPEELNWMQPLVEPIILT